MERKGFGVHKWRNWKVSSPCLSERRSLKRMLLPSPSHWTSFEHMHKRNRVLAPDQSICQMRRIPLRCAVLAMLKPPSTGMYVRRCSGLDAVALLASLDLAHVSGIVSLFD